MAKPKVKQYRALINLVYSDLIAKRDPKLVGQPLAMEGEITELYPELTRYQDRVQILIDNGFIEPIEDEVIVNVSTETGDNDQ